MHDVRIILHVSVFHARETYHFAHTLNDNTPHVCNIGLSIRLHRPREDPFNFTAANGRKKGSETVRDFAEDKFNAAREIRGR